MKFISWNIDSLNAALTGTSARAALSLEVLKKLAAQDADIIALQETKLPATGPSKKHMEGLEEIFPSYKFEWVSSREPARKGYAGCMTIYKGALDPVVSRPSIGAPDTMDYEGRILTLEFDDFYFSQVYTPNAGDGLRRLADRQIWDEKYADYLQGLDQKKPVIACGDYNVAHMPIDLANPDSNTGSAGFTKEEREGFSRLLERGFIDSFRQVNGQVEGVYSWWAQRVKTSKINNSGWRIDYFITSQGLADKIKRSEMIDSGSRQDHTPILLEIGDFGV